MPLGFWIPDRYLGEEDRCASCEEVEDDAVGGLVVVGVFWGGLGMVRRVLAIV